MSRVPDQDGLGFRDSPETPALVTVRPGTFRMGSDRIPDPMYVDEMPARRCTVEAGFAVGTCPVTAEELLSYLRESSSSSLRLRFFEDLARTRSELPAVMVSWHEACDYCRWLSQKTGQEYRLLTEVEWEYVCRAGTETDYWWGDEFDPERANSRHEELLRGRIPEVPGSYSKATADLAYLARVTEYKANPWGLWDVHGNVWEWVQDVYEDQRTRPHGVAPRLGREPYRSLRGGSWMDPPASLRSAVRSWANPRAKDRNIGFRVARDSENGEPLPASSGADSVLVALDSRSGSIHETSSSIFDLVRQLEEEDGPEYLYRGQNGVYGPEGDFRRQIPSVYRACSGKEEVDAALRACHLQVAWLFDRVRRNQALSHQDPKRRLELDFASLNLGDLNRSSNLAQLLGIAQHYGIRTESLDLALLEPAAVFATQSWLSIRSATQLPEGAVSPLPPGSELGFLYRFDVRKLSALGVAVQDISMGYAGSRPILQEGRLISLQPDQDRQLLAEGAYEVFPFRQTRPFTYTRSLKPSPLLKEDQAAYLQLAQVYRGRQHPSWEPPPIAMRDLTVTSFYFSPHPHAPNAAQLYLGDRPDPFLALGRLCEEELPEARELASLEGYARDLFRKLFGKSIGPHSSLAEFLRLQKGALNRKP